MPVSDFTQTAAKLKAKYEPKENKTSTIDDSATGKSTDKYPNEKAVVDYCASLTQVQADWTETDNTKKSFIKNKITKTDDWGITISETAGTGSVLKSYAIKQGTSDIGTISIPKDFLVKSGSVKKGSACSPVQEPQDHMFIDFVINAKSGTAADEHIFIDVNSMIDIYTGGATTSITVSVDSATNEITATINAGGVDTAELASAAVTSTKLANSSVETAKIADSAVETSKLATDAVTNAKLADDAVETANIKDANVTLDKMAANSVDSSKVVDASLLGSDIALETISGGDATTKGNIKPASIKTYNLDIADIYAAIDAALAASIEAEG